MIEYYYDILNYVNEGIIITDEKLNIIILEYPDGDSNLYKTRKALRF